MTSRRPVLRNPNGLERRVSDGFQVSEDQFEAALDLLCAHEPERGLSLGDLLGSLLLCVGAELPSAVITENAVAFLREQRETIAPC